MTQSDEVIPGIRYPQPPWEKRNAPCGKSASCYRSRIPALLAGLSEPVRTMVSVGILTGLRVGEILALRWRDLDFASGVLRVERAL